MKNKLYAEIRSYLYTIWNLTEKTSNKTTFVLKFILIFYIYSLATYYRAFFGFRYTNKSTFWL